MRRAPPQVNAVAVHATGTYAVTLSSDSTWCFYDLPSATCLSQARKITLSHSHLPTQCFLLNLD